jgi:hypothetical protein
MADFVEKVESPSFAEIRLNSSEIFDLIWLPLQIDYGHLGLTRPRIMRAPRPSQETKPTTREKMHRVRKQTFSTESARTGQSVMSAVASAAGGEAENICSVRASPVMTHFGPAAHSA